MTADKIGKISMFSDFNKNLYLGLFWSEELIGNAENCIQGHCYDATVSKMAANKIDKLLMVSDFNENWYLGVFWSDELVGALNSDMRVAWGLLCLHPNTIKPSYGSQMNRPQIYVFILFIVQLILMCWCQVYKKQEPCNEMTYIYWNRSRRVIVDNPIKRKQKLKQKRAASKNQL